MMETLIILHTNDIHGQFENMPRIATGFNELEKKHHGRAVLRLDCGDHMDRMRTETEGTLGKANVEIMNATGYEFFVLGNNEGLTFPIARLEEAMRDARFTVLGTNLSRYPTPSSPEASMSWAVPHAVVRKGGLRVGLIGVTVDFNEFYHSLGLHIYEPFESVQNAIYELREKVDLLIVVSHLGLPNDRRMAETMSGIDCILGAHTHHLLEEGLVVGETLICAAGKFGDYLGEVELEYDRIARKVSRRSATVHRTDQFRDDREVASIIQRRAEEARQALSRRVSQLAEPLTAEQPMDAPLANLLADGLRRWTGTDIALVNSGQVLEGLQAGDVTLERLLEICPSPINPCRMKIKGEAILQSLEEALLHEFVTLPIRGFGFRGKVLGTLALSGLEAYYDPEGLPYRKIKSVRIAGRDLLPDKLYWIGTIDMFTFGIGYKALKEGEPRHYFLPEFLRDVLAKELRNPRALQACLKPRWHKQTS